MGSDPATAPRYYYQYDGQGNVIGQTDQYGGSVGIYAYDEFGVVTTDTETNLYWMSVRAYDPTLCRFLQRDPQVCLMFGPPTHLNQYTEDKAFF